jgi:hypothetical protein
VKRKLRFFIVSISVSITGIVHAQTTIIGNTRPALPAFIGWDGAGLNPGSLEVRNNFSNQPINIFAGGAQRATILGTTGFVGIGVTAPVSLLHVNSTATGELFRTQGPAASVNSWRMISGTTERGKLFVLASSNDFNIQASTAGSLIFRTGGGSGTGSQRMRIQNLSGWMLIGTNASAPSSLLHIDGVTSMSTPVGEVFRTDGPAAQENAWRMFTTDASSTEKFNLSIPVNSNNVVLQASQYNVSLPGNEGHILFNTNGANERVRITGTGRVGIGNTDPHGKVHIESDNGPSVTDTECTFCDPFLIGSFQTGLVVNNASADLTSPFSLGTIMYMR